MRNIREKKGFNISQLASRSGISGKTLLEYEEGRQTLPLAHAKLLAKALWVQIEELMPPPNSVAPTPPASAPSVAEPVSRPAQQPVAPAPPIQAGVSSQSPASSQPPPAQRAPVVRQQDTREAKSPQSAKSEAPRSPRAPKIVPPVSEGQIQELLNLSQRLDITQEQLEERVGKPLATLNRPDATEWLKRLRAIADEISPSQKVRYGKWPDAAEDREAVYLTKQRDAGATCVFRLFNGEELSGTLLDFTPYTITVKDRAKDEGVVLRKLAIAYYRCTPANTSERSGGNSEQESHVHERNDHYQPIDMGVDSDRMGQPETPEKDQMDEDRGM